MHERTPNFINDLQQILQ